jgi:hypothetical protein
MSTRSPTPSAPTGADGAPPDLNVGKYSFQVVQHHLDQAAYLSMIAAPDTNRKSTRILTDGGPGNCIGIEGTRMLHRFDVIAQVPIAEKGLTAVNRLGQPCGTLSSRWFMIPDDYQALPGQQPPPTRLDPSRSQRFVMLDECFKFGDDGFYGFGAGCTLPVKWGGQPQLMAGGIGNLMKGFGKFAGLVGTFVLNGCFLEGQGYQGSITCRVFDPERKLRHGRPLPPFTPTHDIEPDVTYIMWRGQKKDPTQKSSLIIGPDGQPQGLRTPAELRSIHLDFASRKQSGVRTVMSIGEVIGKLDAAILFNPLNPGAPGTATQPIPFQTRNKYEFTNHEGRTVGTVEGFVSEGRVFNVALQGLPGQPAIRFGGYGLLEGGTGTFTGIEGTLAVNSSVGISPHALSLLQWLRVYDPEGKYRARTGGS